MQIPRLPRTPEHGEGDGNGGFPEPPADEPARVVGCSHPACGTKTRVRLPSGLPETVVRRVVCAGCDETYERRREPTPDGTAGPSQADLRSAPATATAAGVGALLAAGGYAGAGDSGPAPAPRGRRLVELRSELGDRLAGGWEAVRDRIPTGEQLPGSQIPRHRLWAWASVPLALLGVIAGLWLIQGDSDRSSNAPSVAAFEAGERKARFIEEPGFSLALPAGWKQVNPPEGATFRAEPKSGLADATLWIEEDPGLGFKQFERRSLAQLEELAGNARVVDRVEGPSIETTISELRADPITDGGATPYRVTLRGAGPYRLYFATAEQPGANPKLAGDIELMHGSLRPEVRVEGVEG